MNVQSLTKWVDQYPTIKLFVKNHQPITNENGWRDHLERVLNQMVNQEAIPTTKSKDELRGIAKDERLSKFRTLDWFVWLQSPKPDGVWLNDLQLALNTVDVGQHTNEDTRTN